MISKLKIPDTVAACIRALHPELKKKIRIGLEMILSDSSCGKLLKDELEGLRSYRIGKLRIIYRPLPERIEVIAVGPRKTIYLDTYRYLSKS